VLQILSCVRPFKITSGARALVVVNEIAARTRKASTDGTVWDVAADPHPILDLCLEATVAITFVVVEMIAAWVRLVHTPAMRPASMPFAIVHVEAACVRCNGSISLATFGVLIQAIETGIKGVARIAFEDDAIGEEEFWPRGRLLQKHWAKRQPAVRGNFNGATLHRFASIWTLVRAIRLTRLLEVLRTRRLRIDSVARDARVQLDLRIDTGQSSVHGMWLPRRLSALHGARQLPSTESTVRLTPDLKRFGPIGLAIESKTRVQSVRDCLHEHSLALVVPSGVAHLYR
jgi:hypothetical protein